MPTKTNQKIEFGDFQTPYVLARKTCDVLYHLGVSPGSIVEPTCGKGSFLLASAVAFPHCKQILGFDVNPEYVHSAKAVQQADVYCEDFFEKDWPRTLNDLQEPILLIGNPPWVTNSAMGSLGGSNLPNKSNFNRLDGLEAITGKSNFDISESMIQHLLEWLSGRKAVLAMLCKTVVARKVLRYAWSRNLQIAKSAIYMIDAAEHFGASVDACLLVSMLEPGTSSKECVIYPNLDPSVSDYSTFTFHNGRLVANLELFNTYGHFLGISPLRWRSGIKHDCSRVIELRRLGTSEFQNGLGEIVRLESNKLYPLIKSSDLMKPHPTPTRYMLVTQGYTGEDTSWIRKETPYTWEYLESHADLLDRRLSSIYRNRPRFSIFGVGPYSFAPWKIAISGFSKHIDFHCIGPVDQKPVVFDDTCYFLPCKNEDDAKLILQLLNSEAARGLLMSLIFWDAKRPITTQILSALDLGRLAEEYKVSLPMWTDVLPEPSSSSLSEGVPESQIPMIPRLL